MKYSNLTHSILKKYDVDLHNGFLPNQPPSDTLPTAYAAWDELSEQMTQALQTQNFCNKVAVLPLLEVSTLRRVAADRAMLLLGGFAHAYVKESKGKIIPRQIALPWVTIANDLKRLPIITHSALSLQNWRLKDPSQPLRLENLTTQISFTGTPTETWFFNATTNIEKIGAAAIPLLLESTHLANQENYDQAIVLLEQVLPIFKKLFTALKRMYEECDPTIFFNELRPFFDSFSNVRYLGTTPEIRSYPGGSAAQSSLLQFFDMVLGIEYGNTPSKAFLLKMRDFMPYPHKGFLNFIETEFNLKTARTKKETLNEIGNELVQCLIDFRNEHLRIVSQYIVRPAHKSQKGTTGTGGTNPLIFLKDVRNRNILHKGKIATSNHQLNWEIPPTSQG